jgi:hypothetical protein
MTMIETLGELPEYFDDWDLYDEMWYQYGLSVQYPGPIHGPHYTSPATLKALDKIIKEVYKPLLEEGVFKSSLIMKLLEAQPKVKVTRRKKIKRWFKYKKQNVKDAWMCLRGKGDWMYD